MLNIKLILSSGILGLVLLVSSLYPTNINADVLLIYDDITSDDRPDLPQNGMTQERVRLQHGEPILEHGAVGEPPITRWDYENYSVFFEYNLVITAVLKPADTVKEEEDNY